MIAELEQFPVTGGERTQGGISYQNEKHPESLKEMEALMDSRTVTCPKLCSPEVVCLLCLIAGGPLWNRVQQIQTVAVVVHVRAFRGN